MNNNDREPDPLYEGDGDGTDGVDQPEQGE